MNRRYETSKPFFALVQYVSLTNNEINTLRWAGPCVRWAELRMCSFWAGGISSFYVFYRLLRRLFFTKFVNFSFALGQYPTAWKMANVVPIFKKGNSQLKVNYRPVSLLPCLSKICEKVVFVRLYNFLLEIGYLYKLQSGFRPGDSTVNQLLYFVHQIYCAFEAGKEVRMVFLDISKAFDKVWHAGLLKK